MTSLIRVVPDPAIFPRYAGEYAPEPFLAVASAPRGGVYSLNSIIGKVGK